MPELVVSNIGESYLLDAAVRRPWLSTENWSIHLYANNFVPNKDMVIGDFTEASYPTYAAKTLTRATWTPAGNVLGRAVTMYGTLQLSWTNPSSPVSIYGYYVDVPGVCNLLLAQAFDAPILISAGTPVLILPQLSLHSEFEP